MRLKQFFTVAILLAVPLASAFAYPKAQIHNRAPFAGQVTINYAACNRDVFRFGASRLDKKGVLHEAINEPSARRGACLITSISATLDGAGWPATTYTSSGTGYSKFIIAPTGDDFRVYSDAELARENAATREAKSPGFISPTRPGGPCPSRSSRLAVCTMTPSSPVRRSTAVPGVQPGRGPCALVPVDALPRGASGQRRAQAGIAACTPRPAQSVRGRVRQSDSLRAGRSARQSLEIVTPSELRESRDDSPTD